MITDDSTLCYNIWEHAFTVKELLIDLRSAGFSNVEFFGDIDGAEFNSNGETICVVAQK